MEWRKTKISENYEVSDTGLVRTCDRYVKSKGGSERLCKGRILKPYADKDGYFRVGIHIGGKHILRGIHQLVAEAFIPNDECLPIIDHINGNNQDNRAENLRWYTVEKNNSTEIAKARKSSAAYNRTDNKVKIRQYSIDGKPLKDFNSSMEIQKELGFERSSIIRVCQGKQKTSYGYKWSYLE